MMSVNVLDVNFWISGKMEFMNLTYNLIILVILFTVINMRYVHNLIFFMQKYLMKKNFSWYLGLRMCEYVPFIY